jgi:hypothetical protein
MGVGGEGRTRETPVMVESEGTERLIHYMIILLYYYCAYIYLFPRSSLRDEMEIAYNPWIITTTVTNE